MKGRYIHLEVFQILFSVGEYQGLPMVKFSVCANMTLFSCLWTERWSPASSILRLFLITIGIEQFQRSIALSSAIRSYAQRLSGSCWCFLKIVNTFSVSATSASVNALGFLICKISELFLLDMILILICFVLRNVENCIAVNFPFDLFW